MRWPRGASSAEGEPMRDVRFGSQGVVAAVAVLALAASASLVAQRLRLAGTSAEAFDRSVDGPGGLVEIAGNGHELVREALSEADAR